MVDPRITRHPGMNVRLDEKLALAEREVRLLRSRGPVTPLCDLVRERFGNRVGPRQNGAIET